MALAPTPSPGVGRLPMSLTLLVSRWSGSDTGVSAFTTGANAIAVAIGTGASEPRVSFRVRRLLPSPGMPAPPTDARTAPHGGHKTFVARRAHLSSRPPPFPARGWLGSFLRVVIVPEGSWQTTVRLG